MSMDSASGSIAQLLTNVSQSSSPRMDCDQVSIKSDDSQYQAGSSFSKVKLMCSYGGRIMPRPHDSQLRYIGGDTRILLVTRNISYSDLCLKLSKLCGFGRLVFPKYKLPYEDFDALISVICEEDLETMFEEYDRVGAREAPSKLRIFVFPRNPASASSNLSEQSFVEVLNSESALFTGDGSVAISQQEEIVDVPSVCSSASSSAVVVQKIMEADSALQSDLPPILTKSNISTKISVEPPAASAGLAPPLPLFEHNPRLPQGLQQQRIDFFNPHQQVLIQQQSPPPIQAPQQIVLPPRGPKTKANSPQESKREKNTGSPKIRGGGKSAMELDPPAVSEAMDSSKVGELNRREKNLVERDEEQGIGDNLEFESTPTTQMMTYGSINGQDVLLPLQDEKLKAPVLLQPQQFQAPIQVPVLASAQAPQVQYYNQQPYIIENNMVYYLATDVAGPPQVQPVQFLPRPVIQPMQFQRGGSGPLMARQQPPLQRQLSAATYMDSQFPRPQQILKQQNQQQKVVFPATRMGPGAQSPSRLRDQVMVAGIDYNDLNFVRNRVFEADPAAAGATLKQQLPYGGVSP